MKSFITSESDIIIIASGPGELGNVCMVLEHTPKQMKHSVQFYNCQTHHCLMQNYS